jgi:hypothetical protein
VVAYLYDTIANGTSRLGVNLYSTKI